MLDANLVELFFINCTETVTEEFNPYLTLYTNINFQWFKVINIQNETIKDQEENIVE